MATVDHQQALEQAARHPHGHNPGVTQLEFTQAMADFRTMFPDMEPGVIEAVLRANGGAVDATIDQLLQMSVDVEREKRRNSTLGGGLPMPNEASIN